MPTSMNGGRAAFPAGADATAARSPDPKQFTPPFGVLLILEDGLTDAGCGGVRLLGNSDAGVCFELKHLWVAPTARRPRARARTAERARVAGATSFGAKVLVLGHQREPGCGAGPVPVGRLPGDPAPTRTRTPPTGSKREAPPPLRQCASRRAAPPAARCAARPGRCPRSLCTTSTGGLALRTRMMVSPQLAWLSAEPAPGRGAEDLANEPRDHEVVRDEEVVAVLPCRREELRHRIRHLRLARLDLGRRHRVEERVERVRHVGRRATRGCSP